MHRPNHSYRDLLVLAGLIGLGILGRVYQPEWHFTPIAAVAMFAGFYFRSFSVAMLVPTSVILFSNMWLPEYSSREVMFAVYLAYLIPIGFGKLLRKPASSKMSALKWIVSATAPATLFFLITNWAVWQFHPAALNYPSTLDGLWMSYSAGIPFYRSMLVGDIVYIGLLFSGYYLALQWVASHRRFDSSTPVRERVKK